MKKILFLFLILPIDLLAQDSTVITNLQLRAGTIKILSKQALNSNDTSITKIFFRWRTEFINNTPPNDNANVTISDCPTVIVAWMYSELLNLRSGIMQAKDHLGDFKTSITSKRNGNTFLDRLCDNLEIGFDNENNSMLVGGNIFLTQQ
jgi:hypothetical protein